MNHTLLSDAPLHDGNKSLFTIAHKDTGDFIEDILKGTPTCYLVSGYRGAGKSSFVKRIESEITNLKLSTDKELVFVYANFPKYKEHHYLLRKLIRCFYKVMEQRPSYQKLASDPENKQVLLLRSLYEKTFFESYHQVAEAQKTERKLSFEFDWGAMILAILGIIAASGAFFEALFPVSPAARLVAPLLGTLLFIGSYIKLSQSYTRTNEESSERLKKSMYDVEIADYYFLQLLEEFAYQYRIVFVLDELDKVSEEDTRSLLNEMKPFLISGSASFIIVAGQNLFHQYACARTEDDALLSSLFSKYIHVPLFSLAEFEKLFSNLVVTEGAMSEEEKKLLNQYVHYLVFKAQRVPRRFIGLVRQRINWENGEAFLYIDDSDQLELYAKAGKVIEHTVEKEIMPEDMEEAIKDYYIVQLYIKAENILSMRRKSFTTQEIIG